MKKWEKFTEEELRNIIASSSSYKEALQKIGYSGSSAYNNEIKAISIKYNISLSHFSRTGTVIDLTGQKFGLLTVIKRVPNKNGGTARWLCQCDCGNFTEVDGTKLRRNETVSCGCLVSKRISLYNKEYKLQDLTGQKFGKLTVLERSEDIGLQPAWKCKCECGNITIVTGGNLRKENGTKSCGCIQSKGEEKIIKIFSQYNINFKTQVTFDDCLSSKNASLRFDFGVYNSNKLLYLIEYNGRQHYEKVSFWNEKDSFEERIERDKIKKEYCIKNNIPLIIIPYTIFNELNINDLLIEKSSYIYKKEENE